MGRMGASKLGSYSTKLPSGRAPSGWVLTSASTWPVLPSSPLATASELAVPSSTLTVQRSAALQMR